MFGKKYFLKFYKNEDWFLYMNDEERDLVKVSFDLVLEFETKTDKFDDFSFLVFPLAKAYEGFLKKWLFDLGLIEQKTYESRYFRIGRSLNPDISEGQKDEYWVYDNVSNMCSENTAKYLWDAWTLCRNKVFHCFYKSCNQLDFFEAKDKIVMLILAMQNAMKCKSRLKD